MFGEVIATSDRVILISAKDDNPTGDSGAVHVYNGDPMSPNFLDFIQTILNPTPLFGDAFGSSIFATEELIAIGAPFHDGGGIDSGAVYFVRRPILTALRFLI